VTAEAAASADPWSLARRAVDVHVFLLAGQAPGRSAATALADALSYAETAERVGFAGVWIAEHHFIRYGVCPSAVAFAAHVLGRTSRITVGTAACVLATRHPVALAEEAVLLDELSGGRLALGVARGGEWVDLEVFGTGRDRFERGFPESLDLLLSWLSGAERVQADGENFRFRPVTVVPRPRRPVPVWVAATATGTVELAARRGLPVLLGMHATDEEKAALLAAHSAVSAARRHDAVAPHASALLAHAGDPADIEKSLPALLEGTRDYVRLDGTSPDRDLDAYAEHLCAVGAVGDRRLIRDRLAATVAVTGARHLLLMVEAAGDADAVTANLAGLAAALDLGLDWERPVP
jgi:alkanesulfonate monooxygenase SsuD/methylene tetrahydromethanopterin reductase-like flavin-dependent oxidoreductase (luciferase family)